MFRESAIPLAESTPIRESGHEGRMGKFIGDFWKDGWGWLGLIAPALSITVSILGLFGMLPVTGISIIPWAIIPILIWVIVAYIRRRREHMRMIDSYESRRCDMSLEQAVEYINGSAGMPNVDDAEAILQQIRNKLSLGEIANITGSELAKSPLNKPVSIFFEVDWSEYWLDPLYYCSTGQGRACRSDGNHGFAIYENIKFSEMEIRREFPKT